MTDPGDRKIFAPGYRPLSPGDALVQSDLAKTLRRIAEDGPSAFYEGPVAEAVVETVQRAGGVMIAEDLAKYRPTLRRPIEGSYRGHRVVTFPPPSGGGVTLLQLLTTLERYDLASSGPGASLTVHLMAEAERRAFADRSRWLGDPDFVDVPVANLLDPHYLARRGATIRTDRATPSPSILPGDPLGEGPGNTLHFSATDSAGRAVSFTMTLNQWFGTGIVAEGTGVLLNNEIDDFAIAAGAPNIYGLTGGHHNALAGQRQSHNENDTGCSEPCRLLLLPRILLDEDSWCYYNRRVASGEEGYQLKVLYQVFPRYAPRAPPIQNMNRRIPTFMSTPTPVIVVTILVPPYEKSGNGTPTTGNNPITMPRLTTMCQKSMAETPMARYMPKRSLERRAMCSPQSTIRQ